MSLPSGYKRLDYIQSSGTQRIEVYSSTLTNGKVIATFQLLQSGNYGLFGCQFTTEKGLFCTFNNGTIFYNKNNDWQYDFDIVPEYNVVPSIFK